jgi:protein TonB
LDSISNDPGATPGASARRRSLSWAVSLAVHAALLIVAVWALRREPHEPRPAPDPLVFVEPAPPPPPAAIEAEKSSGASSAVEEEPAEVARLVESAPTPRPSPTRRQSKPAPTAQRPPQRRVSPRATAPPQVAERAAGADTGAEAGGVEGGQPGGVAGGTAGGLPGGVVGGRGREVVKAEVAAKPPMIVKRVLPEYPAEARARRIEGQVLLRAVVDEEGRVEGGITVLRSAPLLDDAAVAALRQWRFTPGRDRDGNAVRVQIDVPMRFQLR